MTRISLRIAALAYLAVLLLVPVGLVFYRTFQPGLRSVWDSVTTPAAIHAFWLTIEVALIAVPLNALFGVVAALAIVRSRTPGRKLLDVLIDLPFAVSPVVIGLSMILLYGREGWFGPWLADHGIQIIFSLPGIVLATIFVSLPFVAREVAPVLREIGDEQEQAAATLGAGGWQTFRRVTLPNIKWGLLYGVILCNARAMGEFGAVSVVSGHIRGQTNTMPLHVEVLYNEYQSVAAFAVASLLAILALVTLVIKSVIEWRHEREMKALAELPPERPLSAPAGV
jgi:sulfate/thiosulfate transport system permease protein